MTPNVKLSVKRESQLTLTQVSCRRSPSHKSQEIGPFRTTDKTDIQFILFITAPIQWNQTVPGRGQEPWQRLCCQACWEAGKRRLQGRLGDTHSPSTQHRKGLTEENAWPVLGTKYIRHLSVFYVRNLAFQWRFKDIQEGKYNKQGKKQTQKDHSCWNLEKINQNKCD